MEYQQASPATTFSKTLANGGGLTGKHAYDGVFGGAAKPGSRMEDYREIFGGSATCSIPVLDFPELKERNTFVEARSSKPDYSMIFGGFEGADFAVPYEELLSKPKRVKNSSKEAREEETLKIEAAHAFISKRRIFDNDSDVDLWVQMLNFQRVRVPAEARCASAGPEHPNFLEEKQAPPIEVSCQSFDDVKQFNISYNKSHIQSKNGINGPTHIAQLNAVPGYTVLIDEVASQQVTDVGKPVWTALNDDHLKVNVNEGIKASRPLRKVVSGPQPIDSTKNTHTNNSEIQKKSSRNKSFSNDISFDSFEIGLSTPSTMPPSNDGSDKGSSVRLINSKFGVFGSDDSKGVAGSYSPPYLDEEIDTNSAAAASAAAVRKAIEEAQAKIKIAKELMERKKQGFQNRVKPSFNDGLKAERREMKAAEKANRSKEEAQEMHLKDCSPKQVFNGLPEHNAIKASQATQDFRNVKKSSAVKNGIGERHSKWTQVDSRLEAKSGKTTKGFSEPAGTGAERETALEVNREINVEKMKTSADEIECEEKMTGIENINKSMNTEKRFEAFDEVPKQEKVQWELRSVEAAFQWDIYRHSVKSDEELYQLEENEAKIRVAYEHNEASQIPEMINEQEEDKSTVRRLSEPEENAKFEIQELENKDIKKKKEAQDQFENEKRQWEADHQEEMVNQSNEVPAREENEKGLDEIHRFKVNERGQKEDLNRVECEKKQEEHFHEEENEKIQNGVPKPGDAGKLVQVHTQELIGIRLNGFQDKEESEKRQKEDYETKSKGNVEEAKENERMLKEDCQMNETEEHNSYEDVESERIQTEIHLVSEDKGKMEVTEGTFMYEEDNMEAMNHVYKLDENENAGKPDEAKGDEENFEGEEVTGVVTVLDNERMIEDFFPKETGKGSKIVEETDDQLEVENIETVDAEHGLIGLDGNKEQRADVYSGETDLNLDQKQNKYHVTEYERVCEQKNHSEEATSQSDENEQDASNSEISFNDEESESNFVSSNEERWLGKGIESETCCDLEKQVEEAVCGLGEINRDGKEPEVAINHEEDETFFESSSQEKWVNNSIDVKASQLPHIFEGEEKNMEVSQVELEEKKLQISEEERTNQSTDKEENDQETRTVETRETEENLQKEVKLGKKHHERKEEVKIREMEKEKERIAVERAIREARERAFAEACERAERAAAERAAAEARERLEKVPAANGKSAAEKASMEAKLKAERAAVERATAEARERALEKALSEKASFQMRNQAEKPVSEKFSGASRDSGIKPSDQNKKGSGPSGSSRYPIFSNNDVPSSTDRFPGTNGESAERYKATFDRNQRTAERAAKALAEKNMRDLLAQKEQAERNRLAEMLDADVKRWSSGKERNLRALLSTLQYILGSDSGWQPIPLTDLISTAAVKKAYRKATLFVHPDKLQQRRASIQQKYTCEKVFDLLKDAWNKFNSEER